MVVSSLPQNAIEPPATTAPPAGLSKSTFSARIGASVDSPLTVQMRVSRSSCAGGHSHGPTQRMLLALSRTVEGRDVPSKAPVH